MECLCKNCIGNVFGDCMSCINCKGTREIKTECSYYQDNGKYLEFCFK